MYIFFGKNRKRVKLLVFDGSGLVLIAKRIERGKFMDLSEMLGRSEISPDELKLIIHGSVIKKPILDRSMSANIPKQRESFALRVLPAKISAWLGKFDSFKLTNLTTQGERFNLRQL